MATQRESLNGRASTRETAAAQPSEATQDNTIRASQTRAAKDKRANNPARQAKSAARARTPLENTIRPSRQRVAQKDTARSENETLSTASAPATDRTREAGKQQSVRERSVSQASADPEAMPEGIRKQFVQVGRKYYFPDGARAFTDRGNRLTTPSDNTEVIRSLIDIAQTRGWQRITVSGTERFRKEAWFAAKLAGLEVKGYQPSTFEQGHLVRAAARASLAREGTAPSSRRVNGPAASPASKPTDTDRHEGEHPKRFITGRLLDHGRAPYRHDMHEPMSYFVKVETRRGEKTVWGVDFERAFRESLTKPELGDRVGLRAVHQDPVTVKAREWGVDGKVTSEKELATHRNRWIVEKESFFETRAAAAHMVRDPKIDARKGVREHPELAGTYLYLKGAKEVAQRRIRDPEDQRKFVATVRNALADAVARGEPLPRVRLRSRAADKAKTRSSRTAVREPALVRE